jgi:hypothetical protein
MPEPTVTKAALPSFDEKAWQSKLAALEASKLEVQGKPNYNPFMFFHVHVAPLLERYNKKERSPELAKAMADLPSVIPPITPISK